MSDVAIRLRGAAKAYRLYTSSWHRAFGIFNIRLGPLGAYKEHLALNNVDLEIQRGERIGIIGRNGSGKSTLLKLISGTTTPTAGSVEVNGNVHVLMNLGTGFHPDFTGRENAYAYLAHMGMEGRHADELVAELASFAEIGQYFDQPLSTYSAGMAMRLMFAASTVINPDLLLLDEVLGVGDAYFVHKSFNRLRELCTREGTTLILVTHTPHMAAEICERLVWVDAGRIMMDGDPLGVINAYEASVRDQEEQRLRQINEHAARSGRLLGRAGSGQAEGIAALSRPVRDIVANGTPTRSSLLNGKSDKAIILSAQMQTVADQVPRGQLYIGGIRILSGNRELATLDFGAPEGNAHIETIDDRSGGDWGPIMPYDGRAARQYMRYGSVFHRLPFHISNPALDIADPALSAELEYWTDTPEELSLSIFGAHGDTRTIGTFNLDRTAEWAQTRSPMSIGPAVEADDSARYGTRRIELTSFAVYNGEDRETSLFDVGETVRVRLNFRVNDPTLDEYPTFLVGFNKDGLHTVTRWWAEGFRISGGQKAEGHLDVIASPLLLGPGRYTLTLAVFEHGYIAASGTKKYFTMNEHLYDMYMRARQIEIPVRDGNPLYFDYIFQHPARWVRDDGEEQLSLFVGSHVNADGRIYVKR